MGRRFVDKTPAPPPITIHVGGQWGSGKTTFCRVLKKELLPHKITPNENIKSEQKRNRIVWVDFVATQFETSESPEMALMISIQDAINR